MDLATQDVELYREYFNNLEDPIPSPFLLHSLLFYSSLPHPLLILDDAQVVLPVPVSPAPLAAFTAFVPQKREY